MSFVCNNPAQYDGQIVGSGQCVAFVQACSGAFQTTRWKEGVKVRGSRVTTGTAIATFKDGRYPSDPTGNHAAIYVNQNEMGITVWDQWVGQPVHKRVIRFRGGEGSASNDGDSFSVIESD